LKDGEREGEEAPETVHLELTAVAEVAVVIFHTRQVLRSPLGQELIIRLGPEAQVSQVHRTQTVVTESRQVFRRIRSRLMAVPVESQTGTVEPEVLAVPPAAVHQTQLEPQDHPGLVQEPVPGGLVQVAVDLVGPEAGHRHRLAELEPLQAAEGVVVADRVALAAVLLAGLFLHTRLRQAGMYTLRQSLGSFVRREMTKCEQFKRVQRASQSTL
jgi:hypothetical protein